MAEAERRAVTQARLDFAIERRVDFVGREHHHHVGRANCILDQRGLEPSGFGFDRAPRAAAQADDHVDPAVVKVERLGAALIAVTEDGDALAGERRGVDVGIFQEFHKSVRPELVEGLSFTFCSED